MLIAAALFAINLMSPEYYKIVDLSGHAVYRMTLLDRSPSHVRIVFEDEFARRYEWEWQGGTGSSKTRIESLADHVIIESTTPAMGLSYIVVLNRGGAFAASSHEAHGLISREFRRFLIDCHTSADDLIHILFCEAACSAPPLSVEPAPPPPSGSDPGSP